MQTWDNSKLKMVEIEINHRCNKACSYCPNSVTERTEKGEMEPALFEKLMLDLRSFDYRGSISYEFYNEPMLAKNLLWFVETTRKYLPYSRIDFYTNGTLLNLEKFRKLTKLGVNKFIVTKHEGISNYLFYETFKNLTPEEKELVIYQTYKDLKMTNRGGLVQAGPKEAAHLTPCYIPEFLIAVTVKGNVLPCFEDYHQLNVMGNIKESPLTDILNNSLFSNFRHDLRLGLRHKQDPCFNCNRTQVCLK